MSAALFLCHAAAVAVAEEPPTLRWVRQFDAIITRGLSGDAAQVYVAGQTPSPGSFLRAYDLTGDMNWSYELNSNTEVSASLDVWADGAGHAYWPGSRGPDGKSDAFLYKFDATGDVAWNFTYPYLFNGVEDDDGYYGISGNDAGDLYIAGGFHNGQNAQIAKHASDGQQEWRHDVFPGRFSTPQDIVALKSGGAVLAGLVGNNPGSGVDAFLAKFDDDGTHLWTRQFGTAQYDEIAGVTTDSLDNIYVTGILGDNLSTTRTTFVRKYNLDGDELWTRQFDDDGNSSYATAIAADALDNVYVTGETRASLAGTNAGQNDAFVRKYDPTGNILWTYQLGTSRNDSSGAIWVNEHGAVVIGGMTSGQFAGPNTGSGSAWIALLQQGSIEGDFNADGAVDGADFLAWQQGRSPAPLSAADLAAWKMNFGQSGMVGGAAAVPEPASLSLLGIVCAAGLGGARTRRQIARQRSQPAPAPALACPGGGVGVHAIHQHGATLVHCMHPTNRPRPACLGGSLFGSAARKTRVPRSQAARGRKCASASRVWF